MTGSQARTRLLGLVDEKYRLFHEKLIPGEALPVLGVRSPDLKKLAAEIAKEDAEGYLASARDESYEEVLLQGLVTAKLKGSYGELLPHIRRYVGKISNWALCDSFCTALKLAKKQPSEFFALAEEYCGKEGEYEVRFGAVMLLAHFVDAAHIDRVLALLTGIRHEGYYVKMAVAWALSICYIRFPEKTEACLRSGKFDEFTLRKSVQKIRESYRVDQRDKDRLRDELFK